MIHSQMTKVVSLITPASVATNGNPTATVSCVGFRYAKVTLHLGTAAASNVDVTLRLLEADSTTYATSTDMTMTTVAPDTSNAQIYVWFLDLKKRKKNLKIDYAPNTSVARTASATIELSRAEQPPTSAAGHGVTAQVVA